MGRPKLARGPVLTAKIGLGDQFWWRTDFFVTRLAEHRAQPLVLRGQTAFSAQGVIPCSMSTRAEKDLVWFTYVTCS